jgi:DNA polymerase-1
VDQKNPVAMRTLLGRRRLDVTSYTEALNLPIQGSCADAMKLAMCWLAEAVEGRDVKLCLSVHDELVCDCPTAVAEQVGKLMEAVMVKAFRRIFGSHAPVGAEVGIGSNWAAAKKAVK